MSNQSLFNYLRSHRKRSGLSQKEVAIIVGCEDGAAVSRYEWSHSLPPLPVAMALEILFVVPASELFSALREEICEEVESRLAKLEQELDTRNAIGAQGATTAKKLLWLMERRNARCDENNRGDGS